MQLLSQEFGVGTVAPQVDESSDGPTHERDGLARRVVQGAGLSHIVNGEAPVPQETLDGRAQRVGLKGGTVVEDAKHRDLANRFHGIPPSLTFGSDGAAAPMRNR